eukprot:6213329-Pleurochrysis_carterae.AAC.3
MPRSKRTRKPRLCDVSHSRLTILNAMSSYGGPPWMRRIHVSLAPEGSGSSWYVGVTERSIRSG